MPIDESRDFIPVRIAVLTISDTRSAADDRSGDTLVERLEGAGHILAARYIERDDKSAIVARLHAWIDDPDIDVILTTGGTGVTGRNVARPKRWPRCRTRKFRALANCSAGSATRRSAPPRSESRATACVARGTYIFALPGSTARCARCMGRHIGNPTG